MHDLHTITPLGALVPRVDQLNGIIIREVSDRALASLALRWGKEAEGRNAAERFLGLELPAPGGHAASDSFSASWIGPNQWLIGADITGHELMPYRLRDALAGRASVTEQTDGWCRFDLEGTFCLQVFERLCRIDIARMAVGSAERTLLDHLNCLVICLEQGRRYAVMGPRSTAEALHYALLTAAGSVN
ncbi:sarcosine oxidase subunit gamma [Shimia sediminis]|uniref:sarcosine oxidase subunit gamma n=1 Tax=Shimia sediminis TaxID=2497945 RepID=UPI0013DE9E9F|nr:sarcosine oxidase, gamma subunit [Shimia sediminis]